VAHSSAIQRPTDSKNGFRYNPGQENPEGHL